MLFLRNLAILDRGINTEETKMANKVLDSLYPEIKQYGSLGMLLKSKTSQWPDNVVIDGFEESLDGGSPYWASMK